MYVKLKLFEASLAQLDTTIKLLHTFRDVYFDRAHPLELGDTAAEREVQALVLPAVEEDKPVAEEPAAEPAPKKTRQKKAEKQPEPEAEANTDGPATPAAEITIDELRNALQRLTADMGMPAGIELLKKFGCNRVSELAAKDEATKQQFLDLCPSQEVEA